MKSYPGTSHFTIRSNEIDYRGQATLPALVSYMQEAAWENTRDLGISMYDLLERGFTWVLQRMRVEMFRYPKHGESITVETWASGRERVFLHRDFRIYTSEKELLGQATSVWLVMDVVKRQLVSVPDFIMEVEVVPGQEPLPFAKGKLPQLQEAQCAQQMPVRWHDIDLNRHVTNTRYLQWALDTLPLEVLEKKQLQEVDIIFKAESILGDTVVSEVGKGAEESIFLHKLLSQSTDKELVQAKTVWDLKI
ncbi:acyl-[acyl-carrier-protein] thioesterase [Pontibacter cellulosilyticus]|uniref:Acyl-ACP thioesterase n=1 Tax=Pontibacter cellulosilyticus TaxID=1720253 RepID=A0A923NAL1_9BACT|nr:acyl-ACP thioesterase domain-containing protein [Pontibacter cellulosilyticus]MBC5993917.1 acyl-ACP thioesterase [Pontibacter cellulosilyticus]